MQGRSIAIFLAYLLFDASSVDATATVVEQNPAGSRVVCVLPDRNDSSVRGTVQISSASNGTGADVQVSFSGLPTQGAPYGKSKDMQS